MSDSYTTTATLTGNKTLILDESLPLAGRVRVTVEELTESEQKNAFLAKLKAIHQSLANSGYQPRSKAAVELQIREERAIWDE